MPVFISNYENESGNLLKFTISGVDVAYVNGLRRTIMSDIPLLVFRTFPYEKNKCNIIANTGRLNNELVKQRLSCIPICVNDQRVLKNLLKIICWKLMSKTIQMKLCMLLLKILKLKPLKEISI